MMSVRRGSEQQVINDAIAAIRQAYQDDLVAMSESIMSEIRYHLVTPVGRSFEERNKELIRHASDASQWDHVVALIMRRFESMIDETLEDMAWKKELVIDERYGWTLLNYKAQAWGYGHHYIDYWSRFQKLRELPGNRVVPTNAIYSYLNGTISFGALEERCVDVR